MGEKGCPLILPTWRLNLLHDNNLRHGTNGFTSPPKEGMLRIFSPFKSDGGLNPRTQVLNASTLPLDHRSRVRGLQDKKFCAPSVLTADKLEDVRGVPATISMKKFSQETRIIGTGVPLKHAGGCQKTICFHAAIGLSMKF